jgi:hypothetical protein
MNSVDTLFSSISNVESTMTINAYGIKIAQAIEVIEHEERAKHISHQNAAIIHDTLTSLLGKRRHPEAYKVH